MWTGDFETGDMSQWQGTLNPEGIQIVQSPALGSYAGHITLTNANTWSNGLHRVEFRHVPSAARTKEGAATYFAWSFYLPAALPQTPSQQIGYWESQQSFQQMMAFAAAGTELSFSTRKPSNKVQWKADVLKTMTWHRIAMRLLWSKDEAKGSVDVWFDGQQVVSSAKAQTLADDNPHFTQVGLLRGTDPFSDAPEIIIDSGVEGDTLADVQPDPIGTAGAGGAAGGAGGAGGAAGTKGSGGSAGTAGAGGTGAASGGTTSGSGGATGKPTSEDEAGCGCRVPRGGSAPVGSYAALLQLLCAARRRRPDGKLRH